MNLHVSKTGYTKLAGGNLLVVVDANQNEPVVLVVLGSSMTGRFDDIIRLTESAVQFFQLQSIKNQL
jgi:D-alanyl-D-alanine carboxypeptidase